MLTEENIRFLRTLATANEAEGISCSLLPCDVVKLCDFALKNLGAAVTEEMVAIPRNADEAVAMNLVSHSWLKENAPERLASVAPPFTGQVFFVGVSDGEPVIQSVSDSHGDCKTIEVYGSLEAACTRFHNVRRVRLIVDTEPVRPPEDWGAIDE